MQPDRLNSFLTAPDIMLARPISEWVAAAEQAYEPVTAVLQDILADTERVMNRPGIGSGERRNTARKRAEARQRLDAITAMRRYLPLIEGIRHHRRSTEAADVQPEPWDKKLWALLD